MNNPHEILNTIAEHAMRLFEDNLVIAQAVRRDCQPVLAKGCLPAHDKTHDFVNVDGLNVELDRHVEATFCFPPGAFPDVSTVLDTYVQPSAIALAEYVESRLLNVVRERSTANKCVGSPVQPITEYTVDAIETALFNAKANAEQWAILFVDGRTYKNDFQTMARWMNQPGRGAPHGEGSIKHLSVSRTQLIQPGEMSNRFVAFVPETVLLVSRPVAPAPDESPARISVYIYKNGYCLRVSILDPAAETLEVQIEILFGIGIVNPAFLIPVEAKAA